MLAHSALLLLPTPPLLCCLPLSHAGALALTIIIPLPQLDAACSLSPLFSPASRQTPSGVQLGTSQFPRGHGPFAHQTVRPQTEFRHAVMDPGAEAAEGAAGAKRPEWKHEHHTAKG
ncbi:hypothetical protein B0I35DRAFT_405886 [Stachybotrys elegans]|uniref:Secreted protein n=1 Tax=Stachybotrys elegans TaxID=80388 RepID=A0A8K0T059_9HYPO|nr:hypothetical protein B0I35DRAFT_405886 [Stachybotrys elegans]